ncbi:MAG TPA: TonB family protein [Candidatus Sulfomarinibacteraceae bacterium]|nr:TonB family protein [Candidatus Sulfomarinibacteraceae bacterium]
MDALIGLGLSNAVTAALLAVAAALIARFTKRPALWYALWLAVLLRLLAPPVLAVALPIPELGQPADGSAIEAVSVHGSAVSLAEHGTSLEPGLVAAVIWAGGALLVLGFALAQSVHLGQILAGGAPAADAVETRIRHLSSDFGLKRPPPAVVVPDLVPPMLWTLFGKVRLILPSQLMARLDGRQTEALLAHELAHLRRRDHWVRHVELAALALFWWNPIAWWATARVRRAQELCCDQRVAALLPDHRRSYADCLVETARFLSGRTLPLGSPARAMADLSQLKGRIAMIMNETHDSRLSLPVRLVATAILLVALAVTPMLTATADRPGDTDMGRPITLELDDADLLDVLATFSEISGVEILVETGVSGTVSASFHEVPWDTALAKILQRQDLVWHRSGDQIVVRRADSEAPAAAAPADGEPTTRLAGILDGEKVFRYVPDARISEPVAIDQVPPKYPPEARKARITGAVVADLVIDEAGTVRDVAIERSPSDDLSAAAIEAIAQWRFAPATMDGEPVAVRYVVTVMFRLE